MKHTLTAIPARSVVYAWLGTLLMLFVTPARAVMIATLTELGSDVVISVSGSFDLSSASYVNTSDSAPTGVFVDGLGGYVFDGGSYDRYSAPTSITGSLNLLAGSLGNSGDNRFLARDDFLSVPEGYSSLSFTSFTATIPSSSFASLSVSPGEFRTITWATTSGTDSFTIQIGDTAVPEPGTGIPLVALMLSLGWIRARRVRNPGSE